MYGFAIRYDSLCGPVFPQAIPFSNGYAGALTDSGWVYIDERGEPAFGRAFDAVAPFRSDGKARAVLAGTVLIVEESGEIYPKCEDDFDHTQIEADCRCLNKVDRLL